MKFYVECVTGTRHAKSLFQRYQHPSNRRRTRRAQPRTARRSLWQRFVPRKSSRSRSESSFRGEVARNRRRGLPRMCGVRPRSRRQAERWWRRRTTAIEDGRWKTEGAIGQLRSFVSSIFHLPSQIAVNPSRNNKRGNRPKPISPFVVEAAYFFFAAFLYAFFLAFFFAAMVQSPVKEWIALAIPRWIAGSQNRFLTALTTRPLRGS